MKQFLAIYTGSPNSANGAKWAALTDSARYERTQAGMTAWKNWMEQNKRSIVNGGSPVGKTKQINAAGVSDTKNNISGYTIVQAESHEAAAQLFLEHPHFSVFPGDSVEIMEIMPIPSM